MNKFSTFINQILESSELQRLKDELRNTSNEERYLIITRKIRLCQEKLSKK
jgi:hypothetical protein